MRYILSDKHIIFEIIGKTRQSLRYPEIHVTCQFFKVMSGITCVDTSIYYLGIERGMDNSNWNRNKV